METAAQPNYPLNSGGEWGFGDANFDFKINADDYGIFINQLGLGTGGENGAQL